MTDYLTEAVRRTKLPIVVVAYITFDGRPEFAIRVNRGEYRFYARSKYAKDAYLAAVKELSQ